MESFLINEKKQHRFTIEGMVDGVKRKGEFVSKYPSIMDELNINVRASNYLAGGNSETLFGAAKDLAYITAAADVLLIEKPEWFNPETLGDGEYLRKVVNEIFVFNATFREGNNGDGLQKSGSKQQNEETVESK